MLVPGLKEVLHVCVRQPAVLWKAGDPGLVQLVHSRAAPVKVSPPEGAALQQIATACSQHHHQFTMPQLLKFWLF